MINSIRLDGPRRDPDSGKPAVQAVIFLHGYGSDGNDLISLAPYFAESLPDAKFFSPNAPEPGETGLGCQWFTLQGYDPDLMRRDPVRMGDAFSIMYEGAKIAAEPLNDYLDIILKDLGLPPNKLALIGFSQGAMMAIHVALRRTKALGAVIGYSGALLGAQYIKRETVAPPPLLLVHGSSDDVVPVNALTHMQETLDTADIPYSAHVIPNHGHGIEQVGATLGRSFLEDKLTRADQ
ncbi:MAG: prolyl oligopeptidase family serine peptidase [Rhodospirillaceae bacterium]|nr:prolyl oligopeptidase family serine peptidase [Rhodospirillaceae bacterium]